MSRQGKYFSLGAIASLAMIGAIPLSAIAIEPQAAKSVRLAQLFYPPASAQKMIRVIGQGTVRQAADVAEIQILVKVQELYEDTPPFEDSEPYEEPADEFSTPDFSVPPLPAPPPSILIPAPSLPNTSIPPIRSSPLPRIQIPLDPPAASGINYSLLGLNQAGELTEDDFAPLIRAIEQTGVARSDISSKISKSRPSITPFPLPSLGNSNQSFVLVKVQNPTPNKIESVVVAAENHLQNSQNLSLDDIKVNYKINECEQLKLQAFEAAVGDAQKRAEAIAGAMNAKLSPAASASEPFFNMFIPGCEAGQGFSLSGKKNSYEPGDPIEVVVDRTIFFTYTIEE